MKILVSVSSGVLRPHGLPKPLSGIFVFYFLQYYFAISLICFLLYQKHVDVSEISSSFSLLLSFNSKVLEGTSRAYLSRPGQPVPWRCVQLLSISEMPLAFGQHHLQWCLSWPGHLGTLVPVCAPTIILCGKKKNKVWSISSAYEFFLDFSACWSMWYITHWSQQHKDCMIC